MDCLFTTFMHRLGTDIHLRSGSMSKSQWGESSIKFPGGNHK